MADSRIQSNSQSIRRMEEFCSALLATLNALESAMRRLHPPLLPNISQALEPLKRRWDTARGVFNAKDFPAELLPLTHRLNESGNFADQAMHCLREASASSKGIGIILTAMRSLSRAQEILYPMHSIILSISRYFLEEPVRNRPDEYLGKSDLQAGRGVSEMQDAAGDRNGYYLYVPETYDEKTELPLVVALHGGSGSGRDFIWMWLREARSRHFLLMAPSSTDRTWSFDSRLDADKIVAAVHGIIATLRVSEGKVLLTGFSDGAIYTMTLGLLNDSPFTAFAPISGVLHPYNLRNAKQKRIYLVHGSLDWMFPVHHAHQAHALLKASGADIVFHEIAELSHTYPREANGPILEWFDRSLSLGANNSS